MNIWRLCLGNIILGLLAGGAMLWLSMPPGTPFDTLLVGSVPWDHVLGALTVGTIVIAVSGIAISTIDLALGLRTARRRAARLLSHARPADHPISEMEWVGLFADTPLQTIVWDLVIVPPRLAGAAPDGPLILASPFLPSMARMKLLRLHWRRVALMHVWAALVLLVGVAALPLLWWDPVASTDKAIAILAPAGIGIIAVVSLAGLARLLISTLIDGFVAILDGLPMVSDLDVRIEARPRLDPIASDSGANDPLGDVLPLSLHMRIGPAIPDRVIALPDAQQPAPEHSESIAHAPLPEAADIARLRDRSPISNSASKFGERRLTTILSAIEKLQTQQGALGENIAALLDPLRKIMASQLESAKGRPDLTDDSIDRVQSAIEEIAAHARSAEDRLIGKLAGLAREIESGLQSNQKVTADVATSINRLEARIVPVLRHVAAVNRAMTMLMEHVTTLEQQIAKIEASVAQWRTPGEQQAGEMQPWVGEVPGADSREIASELRQLLTELEDIAPDDQDSAIHKLA